MVRFFHKASQWLVLLPIGVFLYDVVYEWVVNARYKLRTTGEWIAKLTGQSPAESLDLAKKVLPDNLADMVVNNHACIVTIAFPVIFYLLYLVLRSTQSHTIYRHD